LLLWRRGLAGELAPSRLEALSMQPAAG